MMEMISNCWRNEMSIIVSDPALLAQLAQANTPVEVRTPDGRWLGTFDPANGKLPPGVHSPYSDQEIEERRKQPDGRPLADILRDLEKRR